MSYELFNYEVQIINFKVQTSKFKEYSIACNALAGANIKAKEIIAKAAIAALLYHLSFFIYHLAKALLLRILHAACHAKRCCYCGEN